MNLGIIGCGYIGKTLARAVARGKIKGKLQVVTALNPGDRENVAREHGCAAVESFAEFKNYPLDLVVEAASQEAVRQYLPSILEHGWDAVVMSTGAFADEDFCSSMMELARANGVSVYLPSGAIGGLDLLAAARQGRLDRVQLTTTKPPSSLEQAESSGADKETIDEPKVLFEGEAREAVRLFPRNINVAAALSLAGLGARHTNVKIIADPGVERNIHQVEAEGDFGSFKLTVENMPAPDNPGTSYLASLSGIALLAGLCENVRVGT